MDNSVLDLVKGTPNILGQIYTDLAQPSVKAVGQALGTVFEFSTSFLLPVKLLNEKFKMNFKKRITEYEKKLEEIPEDKRCEVHPQVGTPIIEKLSYTTNDEIADLFTTLLVNASNIDMVNTAHPAFISIIERLSPDEARIIKYLKGKEDIQYCDFRANSLTVGFNTILEHANLIIFEVKLDFPNNLNAYLSNFVSLGILYDMNGSTYRINETVYNKIKEVYQYEQLKKQLVPNIYKSIDIHKSYYKVTDFGKLFIQACIK